MRTLEYAIEKLFLKVGGVAFPDYIPGFWGRSIEHPKHVAPPEALGRVVRIAFLIGMLMMFAVQRHPLHRAALHGKRAGESKEVLQKLGTLKRAVCQQPVIADANSQAAANKMQQHGHGNGSPISLPENSHHAQMKCREKDDSEYVKLIT